MVVRRVSTGSPDFDALLGGGLESGAITQIYGEPGSAKSTLVILCTVESLRQGHHVIYIDTEGFSVERFRQIAGEEAEILAKRLFLYEAVDFEQQRLVIGECSSLLERYKVGLIVLDSATALYRTEAGSGGEGQRKLAHQTLMLLGYARRYGIPVLVTNQVYMDTDREVLKGLGGTALKHLSKAIIKVEKINSARRATLEKHRSLPEGGSFDFEIVERGISRR
jgi:DNA repair protein RadB